MAAAPIQNALSRERFVETYQIEAYKVFGKTVAGSVVGGAIGYHAAPLIVDVLGSLFGAPKPVLTVAKRVAGFIGGLIGASVGNSVANQYATITLENNYRAWKEEHMDAHATFMRFIHDNSLDQKNFRGHVHGQITSDDEQDECVITCEYVLYFPCRIKGENDLYEYSALKESIAKHKRSPITNSPVSIDDIVLAPDYYETFFKNIESSFNDDTPQDIQDAFEAYRNMVSLNYDSASTALRSELTTQLRNRSITREQYNERNKIITDMLAAING